ncbi:membrane protein [Mesorhizobium sp. L-8-3]|nr:membrane protein [Mesorhizobium sp. L-8-3]
MLGGVTGLIAHAFPQSGPAAAITVVGVFIAFSSVFAVFQYREQVAENDFSVTSVVAAMLTFALGVVAVVGDIGLASAGGVVLVAVLASREALHGFVRRLSWDELRAAIILLAMTFVILPLVPSDPIGPFGGISPARTWILVIMLAAISFCGYIAVKMLGSARGELVAGAVGGLVSSTGTTLTNARRAADGADAPTLAAGTLAASAVSCIRTAFLVGLLAAPLMKLLVPALLAAALVMIAYAGLLARKDATEHQEHKPKNPFDLDSVVTMALVLVAVAFIARAAAAWYGESGVLVVSTLSGLADVDAVTVTVAGMLDTLSTTVAAAAIGIAVASNTMAKAAYAIAFGSRAFAIQVALALPVSLVAGAAVFWLSAVA